MISSISVFGLRSVAPITAVVLLLLVSSVDSTLFKAASTNSNVAAAEPAVWGDPPPDYSAAVLEGTPTYLYTLIFVDSKISRHYKHDMGAVKQDIMRMLKEANEYFYQLDVRLNVVDVLQTMRDDLSLYSFQEFHTRRLSQLPYHDFAALISYRYAGGLAYVNGMCTHRNVLLCGFYPHNPEAMAAIFFHETAHLLGVPHDARNETINVTNCVCNERSLAQEILDLDSAGQSPLSSQGCLKIPGYDHDCTAQYLANVVPKNRCLPKEPRSHAQNLAEGYIDWSHAEALSICGNGIREAEEACDCGLARRCDHVNCVPSSCERKVSLTVLLLVGVAVCLLFCAVVLGVCYGVMHGLLHGISVGGDSDTRKWKVWKIASEPLRLLKRIIFAQNGTNRRRVKRNVSVSRFLDQKTKLTDTVVTVNPMSLPKVENGTLKPLRPTSAPPPPPTGLTLPRTVRPARPPPPVIPQPSISPNNIPVPSSAILLLESQLEFADHEDDSISHKFLEFDEEDELC